MSKSSGNAAALVDRIRRHFPTHPVPAYPPNMGLDPLGEVDEYAAFADVPWPDVPPQHFGSCGYDVSPAIGFANHSPPHIWNYYVPGFMTAALLHDEEHEVTDGFLWQMRRVKPARQERDEGLAWWDGSRPFGCYTESQAQCVIDYLEHIRDHGSGSPHHFDWEVRDERTLHRWLARG